MLPSSEEDPHRKRDREKKKKKNDEESSPQRGEPSGCSRTGSPSNFKKRPDAAQYSINTDYNPYHVQTRSTSLTGSAGFHNTSRVFSQNTLKHVRRYERPPPIFMEFPRNPRQLAWLRRSGLEHDEPPPHAPARLIVSASEQPGDHRKSWLGNAADERGGVRTSSSSQRACSEQFPSPTPPGRGVLLSLAILPLVPATRVVRFVFCFLLFFPPVPGWSMGEPPPTPPESSTLKFAFAL